MKELAFAVMVALVSNTELFAQTTPGPVIRSLMRSCKGISDL
jgi:hypothetical protein